MPRMSAAPWLIVLYGCLVWNLLHVIHVASRILRWLLYFWKLFGSLY
jgi:hypothetical protein